MNTVPTNPEHTLVDAAEAALRTFGSDLDERTAERLLSFWHRYNELTSQDIDAVVARFREATSS
jgi:hypothetical protein